MYGIIYGVMKLTCRELLIIADLAACWRGLIVWNGSSMCCVVLVFDMALISLTAFTVPKWTHFVFHMQS
jgi:predicted phage tail protein